MATKKDSKTVNIFFLWSILIIDFEITIIIMFGDVDGDMELRYSRLLERHDVVSIKIQEAENRKDDDQTANILQNNSQADENFEELTQILEGKGEIYLELMNRNMAIFQRATELFNLFVQNESFINNKFWNHRCIEAYKTESIYSIFKDIIEKPSITMTELFAIHCKKIKNDFELFIERLELNEEQDNAIQSLLRNEKAKGKKKKKKSAQKKRKMNAEMHYKDDSGV